MGDSTSLLGGVPAVLMVNPHCAHVVRLTLTPPPHTAVLEMGKKGGHSGKGRAPCPRTNPEEPAGGVRGLLGGTEVKTAPPLEGEVGTCTLSLCS